MSKFINRGGSGEEEAKDVRDKRNDGAPGERREYGNKTKQKTSALRREIKERVEIFIKFS